jgi:uncharacterized protein Veg
MRDALTCNFVSRLLYCFRLNLSWAHYALVEANKMEELEVNHVDEIHQKLINMVGERIRVKANMGRTRVVERMGTIKTVHPSVFIVEVDERRGRKSRQSYQYVDVLTGTVELFDPESGEHIFVPLGNQLEE